MCVFLVVWLGLFLFSFDRLWHPVFSLSRCGSQAEGVCVRALCACVRVLCEPKKQRGPKKGKKGEPSSLPRRRLGFLKHGRALVSPHPFPPYCACSLTHPPLHDRGAGSLRARHSPIGGCPAPPLCLARRPPLLASAPPGVTLAACLTRLARAGTHRAPPPPVPRVFYLCPGKHNHGRARVLSLAEPAVSV